MRLSSTVPRWLWQPTAAFALSRLFVALTIYVAVPLIPDSTEFPPYHIGSPENVLIDVLGSRWDTGFYVSIVQHGYILDASLPNVAFFPFLPLLMWALTPLTKDIVLAGILISNVALWIAAILFHRLVEMSHGERVASRAVWYLLIFPMAFYGSAIYTESLFLLTTIGALYTARLRRWRVAGLFAIAATATRLVGLLVVPMLLIEWWIQQSDETNGIPPSRNALLAPAVAPLGLGVFMLYLGLTFGDPLAFAQASAAWGRAPQSPLAPIVSLLQSPPGTFPIAEWTDLIVGIFFLTLGVLLLLKKYWSEGTFVTLGVLLCFSSGPLASQPRYMWALFPAFVVLAHFGEKNWANKLITAIFLAGLAVATALFANGYWVA